MHPRYLQYYDKSCKGLRGSFQCHCWRVNLACLSSFTMLLIYNCAHSMIENSVGIPCAIYIQLENLSLSIFLLATTNKHHWQEQHRHLRHVLYIPNHCLSRRWIQAGNHYLHLCRHLIPKNQFAPLRHLGLYLGL